MSLSQSEVEQFERNGFLGPFTVLSPEIAGGLCSRILEEILSQRSEVYAHTEPKKFKNFDYSGLNFVRDRHLDSPLLYRIASSSAIVSRVASLLGRDLLLWRSDLFRQVPDGPTTFPHQDADFSATAPYPCIEAGEGTTPVGVCPQDTGEVKIPLTITAWMAFTPMREETGTIWVVPGSHRDGFIPMVPIASDAEGAFGKSSKMSIEYAPSDRQTIVLEPGQFILFSNLLVHGSYPIKSGERLAWGARYISPETRVYPRGPLNAQGQDLSRYGAVLVSGRDRLRCNKLRAAPMINTGPLSSERATIS